MNRAIVLGIAIFFAIVGIALLGGENQAVAGHGCHGCAGCNGCAGDCVGACDGNVGCHGCAGRRHHRRHHRRACHGCAGVVDCCGAPVAPVCPCNGGAAPADEAPAAPTPASYQSDRAPFALQKISFRR